MRRHLAAALTVVLLAACVPRTGSEAESVLPVWEAPSLAEGRALRLDPGEGALVVNVWATWCEPCRREMASLERAHAALAARGIRVVGVNVDEDVLLAREFLRRAGLTFANLSDPRQALARERLGVKRLPTTMAIGNDGRVRWREESARDWSEPARLAWVERSFAPGSP